VELSGAARGEAFPKTCTIIPMLDAEELAEVRRLEAGAPAAPQRLVGEFVIAMGAAPVVLTFCAVMLSVVVAGLGSRIGAAAIAIATIVAWVLRPRRVRRFRIDDAGRLWVGSRGEPIAWTAVHEVTFAFRAPFAATERDKLYGTVAAMTIAEGDTRHVFARGAVFARSPQRAPVLPYQLSELLRASAERNGLRVVQTSATAWVASRS
jgi:hypothetical protein